jgi:hypothetical protein
MLLGKYIIFPKTREMQKKESSTKTIRQLQKNATFTWFITKGYIQRVAIDFAMMEKIIQETFTILRS